jgi:hypothetical protein
MRLPDAHAVWHDQITPTTRRFSPQEQQMSARRLGRLAGLVFVLVAVFGGVGAASQGAHEAGGSNAMTSAAETYLLEGVWS